MPTDLELLIRDGAGTVKERRTGRLKKGQSSINPCGSSLAEVASKGATADVSIVIEPAVWVTRKGEEAKPESYQRINLTLNRGDEASIHRSNSGVEGGTTLKVTHK